MKAWSGVVVYCRALVPPRKKPFHHRPLQNVRVLGKGMVVFRLFNEFENFLVFQTNGKQPYSSPVFSRFCNVWTVVITVWLPRSQTSLSLQKWWARKGGREGERMRLSPFSFPWSLACSSPVSRAFSPPASPVLRLKSKRLRRRQAFWTIVMRYCTHVM